MPLPSASLRVVPALPRLGLAAAAWRVPVTEVEVLRWQRAVGQAGERRPPAMVVEHVPHERNSLVPQARFYFGIERPVLGLETYLADPHLTSLTARASQYVLGRCVSVTAL